MPPRKGHAVKKITALTLALSGAILPQTFKPEQSIPPPVHRPPPLPPPHIIPEQHPEYEETYYSPSINHGPTEDAVLVLVDRKNNIWMNANDLKKWKLHITSNKPLTWDNNNYINISALSSTNLKIDPINMNLKINFPSTDFEKSHYNLSDSKIQVFTPPPPGAYLNYTLTETRSQGVDSVSGLFEGVVFGRYGAGTTQYLVSNTQPNRVIRLQTTWFHDRPDKMASLRFGDLMTAPSSWSGSLNYGGIQWTTNFGTQPLFITYPLPSFHGAAIVPSVLDLYLNNAKNRSLALSPGSYDISEIPLVDGAGNLRIVTTDILGRQQVVTGNYFLSTTILKAGLHNFSYELGTIRYNLGAESNKYKHFVASATEQYSPNDVTALQWHGELLSYEQAVGLGITRVFPKRNDIVNVSFALSNNSNAGSKKGGQLSLGFSRLYNKYSFGFTSQYTTHYFTDMGIQIGQPAPKMTTQVFGGLQVGENSYSANYSVQINRNQPNNQMLAVSYSRNILFGISLSLTWVDTIRGGNTGKSIFLSLTRSLGDQTSVSYSGNSQTHSSYADTWQLQRSLPTGKGYGYSISEQRSTEETRNASFSYQNDSASWMAQYTQVPTANQEVYSVTMSGAVVAFDGTAMLSRQINSSFGLVKVGGINNVNVSSNNQPEGTTNAQGYLVIPDLTAYQPVDVRIDANNIPLNSEISTTKASVAPYYRSGQLVEFSAKLVRSATLTIKQHDGKPIPEGATVTLDGEKNTFVSGTDGETYVTGLNDQNTLHALWDVHDCVVKFVAPTPDKDNPIPDLGSFICTEATGEKKE